MISRGWPASSSAFWYSSLRLLGLHRAGRPRTCRSRSGTGCHVVALAHALRRVVALPEDLQQLAVGDLLGVEHHQHDLAVTGAAGADLLVGRVRREARRRSRRPSRRPRPPPRTSAPRPRSTPSRTSRSGSPRGTARRAGGSSRSAARRSGSACPGPGARRSASTIVVVPMSPLSRWIRFVSTPTPTPLPPTLVPTLALSWSTGPRGRTRTWPSARPGGAARPARAATDRSRTGPRARRSTTSQPPAVSSSSSWPGRPARVADEDPQALQVGAGHGADRPRGRGSPSPSKSGWNTSPSPRPSPMTAVGDDRAADEQARRRGHARRPSPGSTSATGRSSGRLRTTPSAPSVAVLQHQHDGAREVRVPQVRRRHQQPAAHATRS